MRIQITFSKQNALRYIGHLDLHKMWERVARRADLPLAYSQGFHPHPQIQLAAALPLGFSSICEVVDLKFTADLTPDDALRERIQQACPAGLRLLHLQSVEDRAPALQTQVQFAEYHVTLLEATDLPTLRQQAESILLAEALPRERRGKPYDLRPLLRDLQISSTLAEAPPHLKMTLAAREGATGRPEEVLLALGINPEDTLVERHRLFFG